MAKKKDFFWASYADLMTSLFFIMLVLFVLAVVMLKRDNAEIETKNNEIKAKLEEFKKIEEIKSSINSINKKYFEYDQRYKKHVFKVEVNYHKGKFDVESLSDQEVKMDIIDAGKEIMDLIGSMDKMDQNIQYLVILEGQASKDDWVGDDWKNNNTLSYLRALHLKKFWQDNLIRFDKFNNCELVIAGSGTGGLPRIDTRYDQDDSKNQRFLIHIIPKTGTIE